MNKNAFRFNSNQFFRLRNLIWIMTDSDQVENILLRLFICDLYGKWTLPRILQALSEQVDVQKFTKDEVEKGVQSLLKNNVLFSVSKKEYVLNMFFVACYR
jgi:hypothetical protein